MVTANLGLVNKKLLQIILRHSPLLFMVFHRSGKCLLWSNECRKQLGWTKLQAKKKNNFLSYLVPEESIRQKIWFSASKRSGKFLKYKVQTRTGIYRTQLWANFLLDPQNLFSIGFDITEQIRSDKSLKDSQLKLRNLSTYLDQKIEQERKRIARDIHDDLGQLLSILKLDINWLEGKLNSDQIQQIKKVKKISDHIQSMMEWAGRISQELRPGILDQLGIVPALEWMLSKFKEQTQITYTFYSNVKEIELDDLIAIKLFRIFQETLTNIIRHSQASMVEVKMLLKKGKINLIIKDNGIGIAQEKINHPESLGLIGMNERIRRIGGTLNIKGRPEQGTTIIVNLPYRKGGLTHDKAAVSG